MRAVSVHNLYKTYEEREAVADLSFWVDCGEILGLIGPNGAGKSSTVKMMLDFMRPDSGSVEFFGKRMDDAVKERIGYLPEERGLYKNLAVFEVIVYLATLKGMDKRRAKERALTLLEQTGMMESKEKKIKELSKGMGQMIQFIVTIIHDPTLIILDEPFSGLDPVKTELMKNMISGLRDAGKAVILCTHQMNKVEELCDRVLMVDRGREVLHGKLKEVKSQFQSHSVLIEIEGDIGEIEGVTGKKVNGLGMELLLAPETSPQMLLDRLRSNGVVINRFEVVTPSLNEIFLQVAGGSDV